MIKGNQNLFVKKTMPQTICLSIRVVLFCPALIHILRYLAEMQRERAHVGGWGLGIVYVHSEDIRLCGCPG